jgi:DNA replication and repair protein RecF
MMIAKISPTYCANLVEYKKLLRQRNKTLQMAADKSLMSVKDVLDVLDEQLIVTGNDIYKERERYVPEMRGFTTETGTELGLRKLRIDYKSTCHNMRLNHTILEQNRQKEIIFGHTIAGPHRDDLIFTLNGRTLQHFASEGEERATAISLKLAEAQLQYRKQGTRPVLLLDEVAAELDNKRKELLLRMLQGQIFYASTQFPNFANSLKRSGTLFSVAGGRFEVSSQN